MFFHILSFIIFKEGRCLEMKFSLRLLLSLIFLVSAVSLAALTLLEHQAQAAKPDAHKVEMLRIDGIRWDVGSQQFVLDISGKPGVAQTGKSSSLRLHTELQVDRDSNSNVTTFLKTDTVVTRAEGASKDSDGMFQLESQYIPWFSDGYTGTVFVSIKVELKNRGNTIGSPAKESGLRLTIE